MDIENQNTYEQVPPVTVQEEPETPVPEKRRPTFTAGLILGLCLGLAATVAAIVVGKKNLEPYQAGDTLDLSTISKINLIEDVIDDYYYDYKDTELTLEDKREGLYRGIVDSLGDRYSRYFTAEELEAELEEDKGVYYGVGAYISLGENGFPFFSGIMEDTPAERAGIRSGDVIVEVNGESAYGMELDDVVDRVRGDEGTSVHLKLFREGEDDYLEIDVVRGPIEAKTVNHKMLEDDIGYIQIIQFDAVTIDQFTKAYTDIREQGAKALILDLRSNPGGLVNSVVEIARQILPKGLVFYEEETSGERIEYTCDGANEIDIPLVVLVNEYSASAAEILSGSIRDHGIGTLVGTKTYGKGIVQDYKFISDGSAVRLTVSAYYLPNGDNIQGKGIEPDVEVELDTDAYYEDGTDKQRDKAIEGIKESM